MVLAQLHSPEHHKLLGAGGSQRLVSPPTLPALRRQDQPVIRLDVERSHSNFAEADLRFGGLLVEDLPDRGELVRRRAQRIVGRDPARAVRLDDADSVEVASVTTVRQVAHVVLPRQHVVLVRL